MLEILCMSPFVIFILVCGYAFIRYKTHMSLVKSEFRWVGLFADGEHYVIKDDGEYKRKALTEKFNIGDVVEMDNRLFQVSAISHMTSILDQVYLDPFKGNKDEVNVRFVDARIATKEELYVRIR